METYNDNREISCEEITIKNEKIEEESVDFHRTESFHCQISTNATGSSLYMLDIVKEEPRMFQSTTSATKINECDELPSNIGHPEEPDDILSCINGHRASIDSEHTDFEDDVVISLFKEHCTPLHMKEKTGKTETKSIEGVSEPQTIHHSHALICDICYQIFEAKVEYEYHIRFGHGSRSQVSSEAKDNSLIPHAIGHAENKCVECDMIFTDREEFRIHCRNHIYRDKHECNICGKKFARQKYLCNHLLIHEEKKKYKCSICGKGFEHLSSRWKHMTLHNGERPFECETCGKKFRLKAIYESHLRVHLNISHKCPQCGKIYKTKANLLSHIDAHAGKKPECKICSKKITKQYFKVHMESHNGITKKCDQCDKEFKNNIALSKHMKLHTIPKQVKCVKCEICSKKFRSKQYLNIHMENHKGIKKQCDQCGKEFKNSDTLSKHIKWHTEPKREKCEICSKKFSSKRYLNFHMESHNGITKKCDQCDKEFINGHNLRRHMQWHTNPKPFKCENCGKPLSGKHSYTRHKEICKPVDKSNKETVTID